jgi:hypothetical protein
MTMPEFDTSTVHLWEYFDAREYFIPAFQREYEWTTREEISALWDDIRTNLLEGQVEDYFLSTPVIYAQDGRYGIVDGQQRTITFATMIAAFRDLANEYDRGHYLSGQATALIFSAEELRPKIRSLKEHDRAVLAEVCDPQQNLGPDYGIPANSHRIKKSYRYFKTQIHEFLTQRNEVSIRHLELLFRKVLRRTWFGLTTASDSTTAILIFMTMNARGKDLHSADLIRASLFEKAVRVDNELRDTIQLVENQWNIITTGLDSKVVSKALNDFLVVKLGRLVTSRAFQEYREMFGDFIQRRDFESFLNELGTFVETWSIWTNRNRVHSFSELVRCKVRYATCLMISARIRGASDNIIRGFEKLIDSVYAHHFIGERDSNILKRKFVEWSHLVYNIDYGNEGEFERVRQLMIHQITRDNLLLPRDTFVDLMANNKHFKSKENEAQFFLRRIVRNLTPHGMAIMNPNVVNIEHIAPKNPREGQWTGIDYDSNIIHNIGNLTLCDGETNRSLGNRPWMEKARVWRDSEAPYLTTRSYDDGVGVGLNLMLDEWNEGTIVERATRIANASFEIFSLDQ